MLQVESVHKQYSTRVLLKDTSAHLRPGSRVGLVGPNGAGKTTLFRMILEEESPDKGTIRKRPRLRIGYLPQELETITGKTVLDATHRDLYPEHEAERILMGLGFSEIDFSRQIEKLSGGYRMRVALAHLLLTNPDVLLLDARLDLAGFVCLVAESIHKCLDSRDLFRLAPRGSLTLSIPFCADLDERSIVAPIFFDLMVPEIPDMSHDTIEKRRVVADDQQRHLRVQQEVLEPALRRFVQVVGRLVEQ